VVRTASLSRHRPPSNLCVDVFRMTAGVRLLRQGGAPEQVRAPSHKNDKFPASFVPSVPFSEQSRLPQRPKRNLFENRPLVTDHATKGP